jgi:hypothetical protein
MQLDLAVIVPNAHLVCRLKECHYRTAVPRIVASPVNRHAPAAGGPC